MAQSPSQWVADACKIANTQLTRAEWPRYLGGACPGAVGACRATAPVWMIGDSYDADVIGARNAGIPAILARAHDERADPRPTSLDDVVAFLTTAATHPQGVDIGPYHLRKLKQWLSEQKKVRRVESRVAHPDPRRPGRYIVRLRGHWQWHTLPVLCACGCGEIVPGQGRWLTGHWQRRAS